MSNYMYKNSVSTSPKTHSIASTKTSWLILHEEMIFFSGNHRNIPCGKNVRAGGIYSYHRA